MIFLLSVLVGSHGRCCAWSAPWRGGPGSCREGGRHRSGTSCPARTRTADAIRVLGRSAGRHVGCGHARSQPQRVGRDGAVEEAVGRPATPSNESETTRRPQAFRQSVEGTGVRAAPAPLRHGRADVMTDGMGHQDAVLVAQLVTRGGGDGGEHLCTASRSRRRRSRGRSRRDEGDERENSKQNRDVHPHPSIPRGSDSGAHGAHRQPQTLR